MTHSEIEDLIRDSTNKLKHFYTTAMSRISDLSCHEQHIIQGLQLLDDISRRNPFENGNGRYSEYDLSMYEDECSVLNNEIDRVANLVRLLKGDISSEVFKQKENRLNKKSLTKTASK